MMKTILLIEDNLDIRENTAEILELANYRVLTAENGKVGVKTAMEMKPDLIICDIMMPVLDGYGVLHLLHKNPDMQQTPFIFLSAKAEKSEIRRGMDLGADDYVTKPFESTELLNAVEGRLRKAEAIQRNISPGLQGVHELIKLTSGKEVMDALTADRYSNSYRRKQLIYSEGNHPSRLYYVLKGKVKTFKRNEDGKDLIVGVFDEGDFVGHVALLEGATYKENAEALEECELAIIPKADFEELLNASQLVARKFISLLAQNLSEMEDKLLKMAYNSLRKKVADVLLSLYKKYPTGIDISRDNLATMAGIATESLIRTLGDFKAEKLIEIKEGAILIINEKKLENLLN